MPGEIDDDEDTPVQRPSARPRRSTMIPRKMNGKTDIKKLVTWVGYLTAVGAVLGGLWSGFSYVKDRLDAIESSSSEIVSLKAKDIEITTAHESTETQLSKQLSDLASAVRHRFRQDEQAAQDLRVAIAAMQAAEAARGGHRSAYVSIMTTRSPTAMSSGGLPIRPTRANEAERQERDAQRALIRASNQAPRDDPLSGLGGF